MSNINLWLLDGDDLVKYYRPQSETEAILYNALKQKVEDQEHGVTEAEEQISNLEDEVSDLTDKNELLDSQLDKYKDFFNYISVAYDKVDGTWPKCEIDNDNWAQAIYDHIVNNPLKTNEG
jgi:hypothetical protein